MSLKCSLFGCKWDETEVEREREEDGSEVVITIRETETCKRCGDIRVVSENKEVTTLETAADIVADDLEDEQASGAAESPAAATEPADPGPEPEPAAVEPDSTAIPDAESDDAVVTTGAGEHPEVDETPPEPDPEMEDDAVILDDEDDAAEEDAAENGERDPGEWPEEPSDDDDWEQPTDIDTVVEEEPTGLSSVGNAVTVPDGEFVCPECGYSTAVESSSLREGDYCPECHRGSLQHHAG